MPSNSTPNQVARRKVTARVGRDGYDVDGNISGGMGCVWLLSRPTEPKDPRFTKRMAVKTFRQDLDETLIINELRNWLDLRHPRILQLIGIEYLNWHLSAVMPRMDGSLYDAIAMSPFAPPAATSIVLDILTALDFGSREHGIYHLDIKPQNVLWINNLANVRVTDWGISRLLTSPTFYNDARNSTQTFTQTAGTPGYMGPERFTSSWSIMDAADLYSLGFLASELIAGPFVSQTICDKGLNDYSYSILHDTAARIAKVAGGRLGNFITACIAWDPNLRPATFKEAIHILGR